MKYIVITGASSGIGYETALEFARKGKNLILVARREEKLLALRDEINEINPMVDVVTKTADLSINEEVFGLYEFLKEYEIETLVNNAGMGDIVKFDSQDINKALKMIRLNVDSLTILSTLFVKDYKDIEGTQLINVSSLAGYYVLSNSVTYNSTKFFVSSLTEGIAKELKESGAKMKAKVLAPSATESEFAKIALGIDKFDYNTSVPLFHTSKQMAGFLIELYNGDKVVGAVDKTDMSFVLRDSVFPTNLLIQK